MDIQSILVDDLDKTKGGFDPLSPIDLQQDPLVVPPSSNIPPVVNAITHIDNNKVNTDDRAISKTTPEDFFGSDLEIGEVPDVHAKITLIDNTSSALESLNIVKTTLTCRKGVCKADAIAIESIVPDSIKARFSFEEFSSSVSMTNYVETNTTVDDLITTKTKEICSTYDVVFHEVEDELDDFLENLSDKYLPYVKNQLLTIKDSFSAVISSIASKNSILVHDGSTEASTDLDKDRSTEFHNVIAIPIMVKDTVLDKLSDTEDYNKALKTFRTIMSRPNFMHFVASVLDKAPKTYHGINEVASQGIHFATSANLSDIMNFYNKEKDIIATLEDMGIELAGSVETLAAMTKKASEITDPVELTKFTALNIDKLLHASSNHVYVKEVIETFILLNTGIFYARDVLKALAR